MVVAGVAGHQVCSVRDAAVVRALAAHEHTLHGRGGRRDGGVGPTVLVEYPRCVHRADVVCESQVGAEHKVWGAPAGPVSQHLGVCQQIAIVEPFLMKLIHWTLILKRHREIFFRIGIPQ